MSHSADIDPPRSGWQQPEIPVRRTCPHLGLVFAQLTAHRHREGHQWVCGCGKTFAVVSNGGKDKRLVPEWRDQT